MFPLWDLSRLISRSVQSGWEMAVQRPGPGEQACGPAGSAQPWLCALFTLVCVLSTGSRRHNGHEEDWCLPPPTLEPGQTAANDCGDNGQCQGAGPDRAHLLAVYKRRTGAEAQVILPLSGCSSFRLSAGRPCCILGAASLSRRWPENQTATLIQVRLLARSWACVAQAHLREAACK